jgi:hypothetical protein
MKWCVYVGETVNERKEERMNEEALAFVSNDVTTLHPFWTGSFLESSSWAFNFFIDLKLGSFFWHPLHIFVRPTKFLKYFLHLLRQQTEFSK